MILKKALSPKGSYDFIGARSFAEVNPYGFYDKYCTDEFTSQYPAVRAISQEYMTVTPYGIDANGEPQAQHQITDALYHPNQTDSSVSFFEKMAVSTLVLPKTYILVWERGPDGSAKPGGEFYGRAGENIAGFTYLEHPGIDIRETVGGKKKTFYKLNSNEYSEDEVMVLPGGVNPKSLYAGYSPSMAAKKWATLDDHIAEFQQGFFENGAVPAGQMIITSVSEQDYEDTKKTLQEKHRGAGKNNNIVYVPRPMKDGKPADAKIEWIPFGQPNKDIDFKNLFEQANNRISKAYGVSQFILGVDDAPNYATAQISDKNFAQRAVRPLLLRNWTQFNHELNRITGGTGIALTYDYDIPTVADEKKVEADTKAQEANIIRLMTLDGYNLDSVVDAFQLSNSYKLLSRTDAPAVIENDKPDVDEGGEVDDSPDRQEQFKYAKAQTTEEDQMEQATRNFMQAQVNRAIEEYEFEQTLAQAEPTDDELEAYVAAMFVIVSGILIAKGTESYKEAAGIAGVSLDNLQGFTLTQGAEGRYLAHLNRVGKSYGEETAQSIRTTLLRSRDDGLTITQTKQQLRKVMDTDEWRVKRMARTELNTSQSMGSVEGAREMTAETGIELEKRLDHSNVDPCPICASYDASAPWIKVDQPLLALGDSIQYQTEGGDTKLFINDFEDNDGSGLHPNCRAAVVFRRAE